MRSNLISILPGGDLERTASFVQHAAGPGHKALIPRVLQDAQLDSPSQVWSAADLSRGARVECDFPS